MGEFKRLLLWAVLILLALTLFRWAARLGLLLLAVGAIVYLLWSLPRGKN